VCLHLEGMQPAVNSAFGDACAESLKTVTTVSASIGGPGLQVIVDRLRHLIRLFLDVYVSTHS
jgi:hypothetical protein